MSDMFEKIKRLWSHVVVYGLGNAGSRFVGFLLIPIYSRYLTPEDYGVLALVGVFGQILFVLSNLGQANAMYRTYFAHEDHRDRDTVVTTTLWVFFGLSFPIGLAALALAKPLTVILTGSSVYTMWIVIAIGGVVFKVLLRMLLSVLRAREQSRRFARVTVAQTVIGVALAIEFVVGLHLGGRGILLSQLVAELVLCVYLVPTLFRGVKLRFSRHDARDMLGYGIYLVPAGMLSLIWSLSDRYFLKEYASMEAVGLYALGFRFGEILAYAFAAFELAWPPFLFGNQRNPDAPRLYARAFTYYAVLMGFLWLGVSLLAEETVKIMAAPPFHSAYVVVPWIAGAFLFRNLAPIGNVGMPLQRKVKYRPLMLATTTILSLGLNYALIPTYGMMGAAIAAFVSAAFHFAFQMVVGYRLYPVPFEYGRLARLTAVGLGVYVVAISITWGSLTAAVGGKILLLLACPVLLYASGFFAPGEIRRLRLGLDRLRRHPGAIPEPRRSGK